MTAAALLRGKIVRRLRGQCRIDVRTGAGLSLLGDRQSDYSCATCWAPCERHVESEVAAADGFSLVVAGDEAKLKWPCPGCGCEVSENTSILLAHFTAAEVAADPKCHRCRH